MTDKKTVKKQEVEKEVTLINTSNNKTITVSQELAKLKLRSPYMQIVKEDDTNK